MASSGALNTSFQDAKRAKEDEFYTHLGDTERELRHYKKLFTRAGSHVSGSCPITPDCGRTTYGSHRNAGSNDGARGVHGSNDDTSRNYEELPPTKRGIVKGYRRSANKELDSVTVGPGDSGGTGNVGPGPGGQGHGNVGGQGHGGGAGGQGDVRAVWAF